MNSSKLILAALPLTFGASVAFAQSQDQSAPPADPLAAAGQPAATAPSADPTAGAPEATTTAPADPAAAAPADAAAKAVDDGTTHKDKKKSKKKANEPQ